MKKLYEAIWLALKIVWGLAVFSIGVYIVGSIIEGVGPHVKSSFSSAKETVGSTVDDYMTARTYTLYVQLNRNDQNRFRIVESLESVEACAEKARDMSEDNDDFDMRLGRYICYTFKIDPKSKKPVIPAAETHVFTLRDGKLHTREM
ncbi:MAG TPA: hypothetical protein GXX48_02325 [Ochrobactrum intermedium]|uniref:Uncharacterized protein n=1 Tax=Brucella intermedia TaxID=94625 RepID=A0A7V6P910_9HYPH|nr:hypothetical protein [Brucella intermedia]HHV66476.1 hypothetical protein [Brucella intermedia]